MDIISFVGHRPTCLPDTLALSTWCMNTKSPRTSSSSSIYLPGNEATNWYYCCVYPDSYVAIIWRWCQYNLHVACRSACKWLGSKWNQFDQAIHIHLRADQGIKQVIAINGATNLLRRCDYLFWTLTTLKGKDAKKLVTLLSVHCAFIHYNRDHEYYRGCVFTLSTATMNITELGYSPG